MTLPNDHCTRSQIYLTAITELPLQTTIGVENFQLVIEAAIIAPILAFMGPLVTLGQWSVLHPPAGDMDASSTLNVSLRY